MLSIENCGRSTGRIGTAKCSVRAEKPCREDVERNRGEKPWRETVLQTSSY